MSADHRNFVPRASYQTVRIRIRKRPRSVLPRAEAVRGERDFLAMLLSSRALHTAFRGVEIDASSRLVASRFSFVLLYSTHSCRTTTKRIALTVPADERAYVCIACPVIYFFFSSPFF